MRYPPGEKQQAGCGSKIERVAGICTDMKVIAYVVECHDNHGNSAYNINGLNPGFGKWGGHRGANKVFAASISSAAT